MKKIITLFILVITIVVSLTACGSEKKEIVFADAGWDSAKFHNAVAGFIAETAFDYDSFREISGSSTVLHEGLLKAEVDVHMEVWTDNIATYKDDLAKEKLQELGINFDDNRQGLYIPKYVIEGDTKRGIKPMAPDLKTVQDLKKYPHLFPDSEQKGKGRIYGAIPGWQIDTIMYNKYMYNGLDKDFAYFRPGSEAAMNASFSTSYEKGEPIVGYYWEPTWIMGMYDFVLLEDAPYDKATYEQGETACPPVRVTIGASNDFVKKDPEFCNFLSKYRTSSELTSQALAHMQETGADHKETAKWFLTEHNEILDKWLDKEQAQVVRTALKGNEQQIQETKFPFALSVDVSSIDNGIRSFSSKFEGFFTSIKNGLNGMINFIQTILTFIPWWVLLIVVFLAGWGVDRKIYKGIIYAASLSLIGFFGLWDLMNETLSIVLVAVFISLLLGFPIGVLVAGSKRANQIARPILDTMQTMPVFVYLIPAIIFFGLGKAPAVIATTIYAIVPVIRLTSHGIGQVDSEIVEAARSFGSTKFQTLWKVQIPQALPTIMTGVNQTLMMAMAMVVTCSMIGASGLGMEVLIGVNRMEMGRGLVAGVAVVIIAIIMDRLTQGFAKKSEVKTNGR
ncbi:MAG: glycine betaine ABC transporter substrate-binding protein [Oscillospiraceae bacterium]